jgi:hypothetical protein
MYRTLPLTTPASILAAIAMARLLANPYSLHISQTPVSCSASIYTYEDIHGNKHSCQADDDAKLPSPDVGDVTPKNSEEHLSY